MKATVLSGRVKFEARPDPRQSELMDLVVRLDDGRTEKIFASAGDTYLKQFRTGDPVLLIELPGANGQPFRTIARPPEQQSGLTPMTEEELTQATERAAQLAGLLRSLFKQLRQDEELSEETARNLATTAFIQTFRR